ncbi:MAG TPA: enoyl-CoA hydratase-related protein [Acidimicrobiia bacterium]|nr:enoyl-CoA hydratase-related protein [Acidimicrobiia bacterium]
MTVHVEQLDAVRVLTLDDPECRNALSAAMVDEIIAAVEGAEADDTTGALVVTGAAPAFCSGADTSNLRSLGNTPTSDSGSVRSLYDGFLAVRDCTLPTVAAVNGPAVGAGFNLALCCDVRLAGESARFDSRFTTIGLHPGGGHTWMLDRAVGPQAAAALVLFGERVDGRRAVEIGLAWRCIPDAQLLDDAVTLARRAASAPRDLLRSVKASLVESPWQPDFATAVASELDRQQESFRRGWVTQRLEARRS